MPNNLSRFFKNKKVIFAVIIILIICAFVKNYSFKSFGQVKSESKTNDQTETLVKENTIKYQPKYDWLKNHKADLGLTAESAVIIDQNTGQLLYADNEHAKLPPASITKLLTLTLVLENMNPDQLCTVSAKAAETQPNKITMKAG